MGKKIIKRDLSQHVLDRAKKMPVIAILGPRQSGKTTLSIETFKKHKYLSLEDSNNAIFANSDPKGFLEAHENEHGLILDEIQVVPQLLSAIQVYVDFHDKPGYIVITGSQNFLVNQAVSQTLAGRVSIFTLLPLAIRELARESLLPISPEKIVFNGCYPRIYDKKLAPHEWYPDYVKTYLERDVRDIKQVVDLFAFHKFIKLCAGRTGQILNLSSLSNDSGISVNTVKSWLSLLEASYIIFLLQPYYKNFSKRIIKSPKLYFYDTGLACSLLGIESPKHLATHYLKGGLFESFVISDIMKQFYNRGKDPNVYFWRDKPGNEVDCIIEQGEELSAVEIKAGKTITQDFFSGINYWNKISGSDKTRNFLVYSGDDNQKRSDAFVLNWKSIEKIVS